MAQANNVHGGVLKRTVLVVEDNVINRQMLCAILADQYDVIEAENGLEGLEQLSQRCDDISLIMLDVYMPECDGFEFLSRKRMVERFDAIPTIVTTAGGSQEDEIRCLELGATDFVVKPYNPEVLLNRANNLVRLRESASLVNRLTWDHITGLYAKEFFNSTVEEVLAAEADADFDLMCCVVENLKLLNDRHGEKNCDVLLRELSSRLSSTIPDVVAGGRISSDTFAFFTEHHALGWEMCLNGIDEGLIFSNVNVKFGLVEHVDHDMPTMRICNRALSALEAVKDRHGVAVAVFDDEMHRVQQMEQTIRESMEDALNELQFSVFYQPKHDMHTDKTGGAEALVRWFHPELGFVSPGMFIPIFERNGFITKLDLYVWEEACREIKRCQDLGLPVVPISVNASRIDFDEPDLPAQVALLADKYGIDYSLLHVELTETAYTDNPERVVETLHALKERGFHTELDDFGAGYSSLVSLNMLPLDAMKLDMSMIRQATQLRDFRIVDSAIKLAQVMGLQTVVEGVETAEEAQKVKELGCDMIQGYYYSKPLKREEFEEYLCREQG